MAAAPKACTTSSVSRRESRPTDGARSSPDAAAKTDPMIQLLCVEDDPIVRTYLEALLSRRPEVEVVGLVGDAASAFRYLREGPIDVLLLDYHMQGMNGMDLLQAVYLWESSGDSPGLR